MEQCDVLIIGSGGAGLRSAITLHDKGKNVIIVGKCPKREAHTKKAQGGINAALGNMDPEDSWQLHAADTIRDGGDINDAKAVEMLCKDAPDAIRELDAWGTNFAKDANNKILQRFFGAATYRRACFVGAHTGLAILNTLVDQVEQRNIHFVSETYIFSLLTRDGAVNGALGLDIATGRIVTFHAKAVILATGGHSRMFARSSSHFWENNGDGIGLASGLGVQCMDMEMFQFHPTGMVYPEEAEGILVTEAVRGEGGILTNALGERFMEKYDKERMELSARDIVARANFLEIEAGRGTSHGGVYLDISHKPKTYIEERLPDMVAQLQHYDNIDITKEKMEVGPTAHYSMGGLRIDHATGSTGIPNLFAVGEVTSGVHGANRLGGNSLAEILVFGKHTGTYLADHLPNFLPLDEEQKMRSEESLHDLCTSSGSDPLKIKRAIQDLLWSAAGVIREEQSMKKALKELERFKDIAFSTGSSLAENEKLLAALDIRWMLPTCAMILRSALERKESRGAHFRRDYPETDTAKKNIICDVHDGNITLSAVPVSPPSAEIAALLQKDAAENHLLE